MVRVRTLWTLSLILVVCGCADQDQTRQPNVIIILTDDQGWGDVGFNGNTNISTPNLDRIARQGVRLDRFYVSPVCSPTRAELLTGRYHVRSGVDGTSAGQERLDLNESTLAEVFNAAGYATGAFGKWHNGSQPPYHPTARGFDEYYGFPSGHWGDYFSPMLDHNGTWVQGEGYLPDDITTKALAFMEAHADRPFLVYLPYNTPHSPMQVPDAFFDPLDGDTLAQRHRQPEREDLEHTRAALAMTANIDWNVGRILDWLASWALDSQTIVLYLSDNGPNGARFNGGMKGRKGSTDEGGVRVPFVVQWPGSVEAGQTIDQIAAAIDIRPTLMELVGLTLADTTLPFDGVSLAPLLLGQPFGHADRLVPSHWRGRTSIRSQRFRLDHQGALFDMVADPGQYEDVAARHPEVLAALISAHKEFEDLVRREVTAREARPYTVGHPQHEWTHLPARDAQASGAITRSNRYPNDSHFTSWVSVEDSIWWEAEVLATGAFVVTLYYTVPQGSEGAEVEVRFGKHRLAGIVAPFHDPPLRGMERDRTPRIESYVKNFRPLTLGTMTLSAGRGVLALRANTRPGDQVMDFKMLSFRRLPE